jgi:phage tail tape-measure protein
MREMTNVEVSSVSGGMPKGLLGGMLETGVSAMGAYDGAIIGAEFGTIGGPIGTVVGGVVGFAAGYMAASTFGGQ